ncbi:MAG TPA: CARDB domain-containing protein, partial [Humisphaera sp.]
KPGKATTLKPRLSVPTDLPNGNYFLLASVTDRPAGRSPLDVSAAPAAVPAAVAVSPSAVAVAQPVVELSAALADVPAEVRSASGRHRVSPKERVSVVVANAGTVAARSPGVAVYLSTDAAFDPAVDQRLVSKTAGGKLRPGQERTVRVGFRLPAGVPGGAYHLIAVTDPAGRFAEPDEANNVAVAPVTVTVVRGHLVDRGDPYYDDTYFGVGAGGDCGCGYVPTYDDYDNGGGDYVTPPPDTQPSTQPSTQPDPAPAPDPTPQPDPTPPADPGPSDSGGFWDFDFGFEDWWG